MKSLFSKFSIFLFVFTSSTFVACSPSNKSATETTDSTTVNQETAQVVSPLAMLEANFSKLSFPLKIDTVIFEESKRMNGDFLDKLIPQVDENQGYSLMIPAYKKLKSMSAEQIANLEGFDIGEPVSLSYYEAGYYFLENQQVYLALLGLEYETYPADPWGAGKYIFLCSFDKEGKLLGIEKIAENSAGGDPPVWGKTTITSASDKGLIYTMQVINVDGGENEEGKSEETTTTSSVIVTVQKDGKLLKQETQK